MISGDTQTVGATVTCYVTFCTTNSWSVTWSRHFLSVIITIVMGDIWYVLVVPSNKNEHAFSLKCFIVLPNGQSKQTDSPKNYLIVTGRKCHVQVSDKELSATKHVIKHVIDPPTVWASSLTISAVYLNWFEVRFSHECWWLKHLVALFIARKRLCLRRFKAQFISQSIALDSSIRMSRSACHDALLWRNIKLPRVCSLFSVVILTWCWWHFATLFLIAILFN